MKDLTKNVIKNDVKRNVIVNTKKGSPEYISKINPKKSVIRYAFFGSLEKKLKKTTSAKSMLGFTKDMLVLEKSDICKMHKNAKIRKKMNFFILVFRNYKNQCGFDI